MYKKYCLILALILTALVVGSCAKTPSEGDVTDETSENVADVTDAFSNPGYLVSQEMYVTFDEAVEMCDCAVVAAFASYKDAGTYVEYTFSVKETLRGEVEDTIHVRDSKGFTTVEGTDIQYKNGEDVYTEGEDYILIMQKGDSLFYEYPEYQVLTNIFIPAADPSKSTMQGEPLTEVAGLDAEGIKNQIRRARAVNAAPAKDYTTATDLPTIVAESDLVLKVNITDIAVESEFANCNTYYCDVQQILKGGSVETSEERGDIMVTLTKESVEVGKTYVLLLNRIDETSILYTQSSLGSVIPSGDTETVSEIQRLIEG